MYVLRRFVCVDCGAPAERKRHAVDPLICLDCGIERANDAARQMAAKSGPAWDRFIAKRHPAMVAGGNH